MNSQISDIIYLGNNSFVMLDSILRHESLKLSGETLKFEGETETEEDLLMSRCILFVDYLESKFDFG